MHERIVLYVHCSNNCLYLSLQEVSWSVRLFAESLDFVNKTAKLIWISSITKTCICRAFHRCWTDATESALPDSMVSESVRYKSCVGNIQNKCWRHIARWSLSWGNSSSCCKIGEKSKWISHLFWSSCLQQSLRKLRSGGKVLTRQQCNSQRSVRFCSLPPTDVEHHTIGWSSRWWRNWSALVLCLPISAASAERSFSSLQRFKRTRNTISQRRLTQLAVHSINKNYLQGSKGNIWSVLLCQGLPKDVLSSAR